VIADVPEQDIGLVKVGAPAKVNFRAYPNEPFQGRVTFILHELDPATRTGKVRIEVKNPDHRIKHEMYADVEIDTGTGDGEVLAVPVSSVIDSGNRQVVIVDRGEGRFRFGNEYRPERPARQGPCRARTKSNPSPTFGPARRATSVPSRTASTASARLSRPSPGALA
jgi:multidrug efflux pump subunit AcrA (membrane-fusion protein)